MSELLAQVDGPVPGQPRPKAVGERGRLSARPFIDPDVSADLRSLLRKGRDCARGCDNGLWILGDLIRATMCEQTLPFGIICVILSGPWRSFQHFARSLQPFPPHPAAQ
jgi:hypothetical protein